MTFKEKFIKAFNTDLDKPLESDDALLNYVFCVTLTNIQQTEKDLGSLKAALGFMLGLYQKSAEDPDIIPLIAFYKEILNSKELLKELKQLIKE